MKKSLWIIFVIIVILVIILLIGKNSTKSDTVKIGWISDLSGSVKKYGAYEAGKLAESEINAAGGINGKKIEIIYEDGKCMSKDATNAATKLINVDKVKVILGGHCTPESAAIAPIAESNKVIMLAAITSSPVMSNRGKYIFRTTSVSTVQSPMLAMTAYNSLGVKNMAIVYEQTDYARPIAEILKSEFEKLGGKVGVYEGYGTDTNDFKTVLAKIKASGAQAVFVSNQRPDSGINFVKQMSDFGIRAKLLGNDIMSTTAVTKEIPNLVEGMVFAGPRYDVATNQKTKKFNDDFVKTYNMEPPFGIFTAESYDGVYLIADAIAKYGEDTDKIAQYLSTLKNYQGASGSITINEAHDGVREYVPKIIRGGKIENF
ncbi:MAG: ABC transporter substrate-binding protein [Patescibacteria group bacterium]